MVAQFSFFYILSKIDFAINLFSHLFEWKKNFHILLFSKFAFSAGDVIYTFVLLYLVYITINLIRKKKSISLKRLLIFINLSYFVYQCLWGMLYFQTPIIEKLAKKDITEENLKKLTIKYLKLCKETREKVSEDHKGIFVVKDLQKVEKEILAQQKNLSTQITSKRPIEILSVKPSLYNHLMNYTGILGYYNPFTAESQYNPNLPSTQLPFTLAHEMSHQLGFAREQEASFIAYLCSKNSNDQDLKYSYQLYVLKSLLRNLSVKNKSFAKGILSQYSEKMKRDRINEIEFFKKNEGLVSDVFGFTNDLFLKSNQQDGSITYSYFIILLVRCEA
ncbi:DUF3810 domain-containing protein [Epilithonimonas sp. UC225_85]|uniref:DUF3810 domain-containing protein n=1 Tax=Epilithonimonas sp. UC225_85 TaxID=3350167 RepID=UPI0036D2EED0